jgi:hypothetical protein
MRKSVALIVGVLVPLLGLAGVGNAQSTVQVQGTIAAIDCQAQTLVVAGPGSTNTIAVAPYTAVLLNSSAVSLCDLQQYIGGPATAWLVASDSEFVATRIDAKAQVVPDPAPVQPAINPLPIVGIVLGTIVVAGLVYLLVRDDGSYYRYPYYGSYFGYYYRPGYQPYLGWYPAVCPVVFAPAPITGFVLGVTVVGGFNYLVVREGDGHFARYPYYGPYRGYYYRPEYRAYAGQYRDVPVHYGERQNNAPGGASRQPNSGRASYAPGPQRSSYDYNHGPVQFQPQRPSPSYNPSTGYNRGQRPSHDNNPTSGDNRGPQQYRQPQWPRSNYNPGDGDSRRPHQYQQPQRPSYNYNPGGWYNRGGGYGDGRSQNTRSSCNSQGESCSNH